MANMFAMILAIATLITGILWCLERFKQALARRWLSQQPGQLCAGAEVLIGNDVAVKVSHKPGWIESCASIFPVLLLVFIFRSFIFEPFQIPSGSMMPTLLVGDFILVEKFAYGIKDPITQTTLIKTGHPKRGDVVVFKYPPDPSLDYIKRVVGLPGDRVSYDPANKHVTVQPGCASGQDCAMALPITYSEFAPSDFVQTFNSADNSEVSSSFLRVLTDRQVDGCIRLAQRKESLDGVVHNVLTVPGQQDQLGIYYKQPGSSLAEWVVPQGEYFMMGDNRDNSADSRYWGFVPERNLVGKATAIWISFDKQEGKWPTGVRLSRIGGIH
ncbi:signal peptidase I [Sodalis-like endosymbiont of Proechinophthirus fluctus]|uniref:signal peptidase I n=1 Tax=Sodalis-like endosymbiont of Proechinophthirus fluctus TaxID=1462730 RepID=UPI0007A8C9E7|nr:signal peptidase I [Sodalis-like endosymbiont of Proechinophthirus fluctus]KYP97034.1 signal peptidase I [Sodalis-like endosymbiont of Proechinophthirus fluctus]